MGTNAEKRMRQNLKRRARNRWRKRQYRTAMRQYRETILHGSVDQAESELRELYKILDRVAAKGTIHKNKAARYKSKLAQRLDQKKASASSS